MSLIIMIIQMKICIEIFSYFLYMLLNLIIIPIGYKKMACINAHIPYTCFLSYPYYITCFCKQAMSHILKIKIIIILLKLPDIINKHFFIFSNANILCWMDNCFYMIFPAQFTKNLKHCKLSLYIHLT